MQTNLAILHAKKSSSSEVSWAKLSVSSITPTATFSLYPKFSPYLEKYLLPKTSSISPQKFCPLVEAPGEFGPQLVHKPFSLGKLKQIKADLGSYTDNSDGYIVTFQHIMFVYDLTWKDTMIILKQTLLNTE